MQVVHSKLKLQRKAIQQILITIKNQNNIEKYFDKILTWLIKAVIEKNRCTINVVLIAYITTAIDL